MSTKLEQPSRKVTVRLYVQDLEDARRILPAPGYNAIIREFFHQYMNGKRARIAAMSPIEEEEKKTDG